MITDVSFKQWAVVELMGHVKVAGLVTEAEIFGGKLMRVDVPCEDGAHITQYFGAASIYRLTPCTEEVARHIALSSMVEPPGIYDLRRLIAKQMVKEIAATNQKCGGCDGPMGPHGGCINDSCDGTTVHGAITIFEEEPEDLDDDTDEDQE